MDHVFDDVKPFPGEQSGQQLESGRDARLDNQPPLEERLVMDFVEELDKDGLTKRVQDITESAGRVPAIDSQEIAGKVGDLINQARAVKKAVEDAREGHNRPLLNAQRALMGRAKSILGPLDEAINGVKRRLDAYVMEEDRKRREAQRIADEAAERARRAADEAAREAEEAGQPAPPPPVVEAPQIEKPVARGDQGARVGTKTVWRHRIVSVRQLPDRILKNERVVEAIDKVLSAEIRAGTREIKGCEIWSDQVADVRG